MGVMPLNFPLPSASSYDSSLRSGASLAIQNITAFRACHERYLECLEFCDSRSASPVVEAATYFVLDFDITARRAFGSNQDRYRLFRSRFLHNGSCESCRTQYKLDSRTFASEINAIEEYAGGAFTNAGLFPLAPYFGVPQARVQKLAA